MCKIQIVRTGDTLTEPTSQVNVFVYKKLASRYFTQLVAQQYGLRFLS